MGVGAGGEWRGGAYQYGCCWICSVGTCHGWFAFGVVVFGGHFLLTSEFGSWP